MDSTNGGVIAISTSQATDAISLKRKAFHAGDESLLQLKKRAQYHTRAQAKKEAVVEILPKDDNETEAQVDKKVDDYFDMDNDETGVVIVVNGDDTPLEPTGQIDIPTEPPCSPAGQPPVSANIRAALCDSIAYWKAHQGGIQSTHLVATGMLLNGKTTPRDVLQAQVIVTTVGGGLQASPNGGHIRTEDQNEDHRNYISLRNAMNVGQPIGVVIGKQALAPGRYANNLLLYNPENHFNVLAWFFVTEIWVEYQPTQSDGTRFKQYVVRMQKIDLKSPSWWVSKGNENANIYAVGDVHCPVRACQACRRESKTIFREGWCCLQKNCTDFFRFDNPDVDFDRLQYSADFLNERKQWGAERPLEPLETEFQEPQPEEFGSEERFKRGIICPKCKFASRRISWNGWSCEKGCGFRLSMPPQDVPMSLIHTETEKIMSRKKKYFEVDPKIMTGNHTVVGYEVTTFYLPNIAENQDEANWIGSVTVFRPTQSTLERQGGLNDLFQEIQEATRVGDIELRRNPARCKGSHMEELTSHFSCNMGADYKFGVVVETSNGFDTAPAPVMKALGRLTWGGATAVELTAKHVADENLSIDSQSMPDKFIDFNEQLMLGYFEKSQISFHDDGERELGPTVATLSVGSPSVMRFRAKAKFGRRDTVGARNVMLSLVLEHGDMVVMHGTKIHQYYEHAVAAGGIRRYALTCRYIRPEMIPDAARREKALVNGEVPVYWKENAYKGETPEALTSNGATPEGHGCV